MNRRNVLQCLISTIAAGTGRAAARPQAAPQTAPGQGLPLEQFQPKSMLHVPETKVERSKFPVIDIHTHLTWSDELDGTEKVTLNSAVPDIIAVMDRRNLKVLCNLTGGYGKGFATSSNMFEGHQDRIFNFVEPWWSKTPLPEYPRFQAEEIERAHAAGARGIKIMKILGLYLRERVKEGRLVPLDDRRFDPMWETAGAKKMPIAIHSSDPEAFFLPIDRFNERWEELHAHPDWSFYGKDFPSNQELQEARLRVIARHPKTQFICLHVADSENLPYVSECLDKYPNMHVEIAARIGELGRQPRLARKFFEKYQDRVLFGTDAVPGGYDTPQQIFNDDLYRIYYRFLETEDEYFDYAPAPIPPQGRWRISGLGLPDSILKKVYWDNAARLLGLKAL